MSETSSPSAPTPAPAGQFVGTGAQDLSDLAFAHFHSVQMHFLPTAWATAPSDRYDWTQREFPPARRSSIPKEPGVYVFVVSTAIFDFPAASGLFYVGKATNLYDRIGAYIGERNLRLLNTQRPLVWRMINQWNGHLKYYFATTPDVHAAKSLESAMIDALLPPFNKQYGATMGPTMRAFQ